MKIRDYFNAKAVALRVSEAGSNLVAPLGNVFFPAQKKMGLDLKTIKARNGLAVSLAPSNFDAKSTIRSREGIKIQKTQMAFFRESMIVSEEDEQEILRISESTDPYLQPVLDNIYDDAATLVKGANIVPERMIWQLLAPADGSPKISIESNGVTYAYNYDSDGAFKANNYSVVLGDGNWTNFEDSDPLEDLRVMQKAIEAYCGEKPTIAVMSSKTMGYMVKSANMKAQVLSIASGAAINSEKRVKQLLKEELDLEVVVYDKQYKNESGVSATYYPDDLVTLLPNHAVGKTWYGTAPEERLLMSDANADVAIVNTGVAICVTTTTDPVNTKTTVSEIVLPSFEGMDGVGVLRVNTVLNLTGTVAEGTSSGTTKVTLASAGTGYEYRLNTSSLEVYYGTDASEWTSYTSGNNITIADGTKFVIAKVNSTTDLVENAGVFVADSKA